MLIEIKKYPATYVDKKTGQEKKTWHFYLYLPGGKPIQIRNVFQSDNGFLAACIPAETKEDK